jgi:hypothetical protein
VRFPNLQHDDLIAGEIDMSGDQATNDRTDLGQADKGLCGLDQGAAQNAARSADRRSQSSRDYACYVEGKNT